MQSLEIRSTLTVDDIDKVTEEQAVFFSEEKTQIKGFNVYFIAFDDSFGYSYLVYKNKHLITKDFELHHRSMSKDKEKLRSYYLERLNDMLFTDEEIAEPIRSYNEFTRKQYFLNNLYGKQEDYISIFFCGSDEERENRRKKTEKMIFNPVAYGYYEPNKEDFVNHHKNLMETLKTERNKLNSNFEYQKQAFLYEMYNHEYGYSSQGDFDVLSVFGFIKYNRQETIEDYFNQLSFNDIQRRAYYSAREDYNKNFNG